MLLDKLMLNKNIGTVSKTGVGATLPGVQIPLSPPQFKHLAHLLSAISLTLRIHLEYSVRILREKRIAILCFFCQKKGPGIVLFYFSIISQLLVFCPALSLYPIGIHSDVTRGDLTPSSSVIVAPGLLPDMFPCRHGRRAKD